MPVYKDALLIDGAAPDERLKLAAKMLERCEGVVLLEGVVALRPTRNEILCEVIDPTPGAHRCAEEYNVLMENAQRAFARSKLAELLPGRRLRWSMVDDSGTRIGDA